MQERAIPVGGPTLSRPFRRLLLAVPMAALLGSATGCGHSGGDQSEGAKPVVPVVLRRLELGTLRETVKTSGQWRVADSVTVFAPFRAYVETLRPHAGDPVTRGQTIGMLITYESKAAVRGAEILVQQARTTSEREEAARALRLATLDLVSVPLIAPTSGTVLRRSVEPGSEAAEAGELLTIVPLGSVVFEAHVPRADAARVTTGQHAVVGMDGSSVIATVERRLPQTSEGDQTALFWLAPGVRAPFGVLGRFGNATIETGAAHEAILVPDSALVEDDLTGQIRIARVVPGSIAIWTQVRLGNADEGHHELLAPALPAGTLVVIQGQRGLPDSTQVAPRP